MQHHTAYQLHVEVAHTQHAFAGLTNYGKCLRHQGIERFAAGQAGAKFSGLGLQRLVRECFHCRLMGVNTLHLFTIGFEQSVVTATDERFEQARNHEKVPKIILAILPCCTCFICP